MRSLGHAVGLDERGADERQEDVGECGLRFLEDRTDNAEQAADEGNQNGENILVRRRSTGRRLR